MLTRLCVRDAAIEIVGLVIVIGQNVFVPLHSRGPSADAMFRMQNMQNRPTCGMNRKSRTGGAPLGGTGAPSQLPVKRPRPIYRHNRRSAAPVQAGQRLSRCGGALVRVCQLPSGAWYFSPGWVRAISTQPCVSAYSSSCAFCASARWV